MASITRGLLAAGLLFAAAAAQAQQAARIVVGFTPGGSTDVLARYLSEPFRGVLGRPVIVENKPGAAGRLAVEAVKAAAPDGNTLVLVPSGPMTLFPHIFRELRFDPFRDFVPIVQLATQDLCIATGPGTPAKTLSELRAWARANPAKASYGSSGAGTLQHFTGVLFAQRAGLDLTLIPYKGTTGAVTDLAAGQVPMLAVSCTELLEMHRAGRVRILASSGPVRTPFTPDVPTLKESGLDVEVTAWFGVYGPTGMSPALVGALNKAAVNAVRTPEGKEQLFKLGFVATGTSPEELARAQKRDYELWGEAAKLSGFKPES